jgi:hypothetical protein
LQIEELTEKASKVEINEDEQVTEESDANEHEKAEEEEVEEEKIEEEEEIPEPAAPKILSYMQMQQQQCPIEIEVTQEITPAINTDNTIMMKEDLMKGDGVTPNKDVDESESSTAEKNTTTPLESPGTPGQGEGNSSEISSLPRSSPEASPTSSGNSSGNSSKIPAEPLSAHKKTEKSAMGNSAKSTGSAKSTDSKIKFKILIGR